ncbi:MAG: DUF1376 domain-containing protein [Acetobacter sp.]|uniref:DUF1376 domain-containing protein n=1 Tax=Acetobacter sp. TaxID=440 RepID=UPI0039E87017
MSDLPDPLTPEDCDLRGLPFMQLDVVRLIDSDLFALSTGDEFKASVALWCKSWLQIPAASLPDDDRVLAHLSGAGSKWKRVKAIALRGWIKCSDGRLYHPTVSEKAHHAWKARTNQRERAAKRWNKNNKTDGNATALENDMPRHSHGISQGNAIERERERERENIYVPSERRDDAPNPVPDAQSDIEDFTKPPCEVAPPSPQPSVPPDARTALFKAGLKGVRSLTGKPDAASRAMIGRWLKTAKDDAAVVNSAISAAIDLQPANPVAWIEVAVRGRGSGPARQRAVEDAWAGVPDIEGV